MKFAIQSGQNRAAAMCAVVEGLTAEPARDVTPIGSVEWTREYAVWFGVALPETGTYPKALRPWLLRSVRRGVLADALPSEFVKPVRCKAFTGAICRDLQETADPAEPVWISEPVTWAAEWRVYVKNGTVAGWAQYGEGDDDEPDMPVVKAMLAAYSGPAGWALDVGRLDDGRMALVEANDGWALGYYRGCPRMAYLETIAARWVELAAKAAGRAG